MLQANETALVSVVGQLRWALTLPRRCGDDEWGERLEHLLARLQQALERHAAFMESADGLLNQVADPMLLPFTKLIRLAGELRQQHRDLCDRLCSLRRQLRGLTHEAGTDVDSDEANGCPRAEEMRVFVGLGAICRLSGQLLTDIETHLAREAGLCGVTEGSESGD
jgi:hypothetical protein